MTDCGARTADQIIAWASARRTVAHSVPLQGVPRPSSTDSAEVAAAESVQGGAVALATALEKLRQSHGAPSGEGGKSWDLRVALVLVPADLEIDAQQQQTEPSFNSSKAVAEAAETEAAFRSLAVRAYRDKYGDNSIKGTFRLVMICLIYSTLLHSFTYIRLYLIVVVHWPSYTSSV